MDATFWGERWRTGQIGFHEGVANALLTAHHDAIADAHRVYVPLCGKAFDLMWLRERGHDVAGVELVPEALEQLWHDTNLVPLSTPRGAFTWHHVEGDAARGQGRLDLLCGDALAVDAPLFAAVAGGLADAIYDRAALVALHPAQRTAYLASWLRVLRPGGRVLLITFSYDQTKIEGPPWSVDESIAHALFDDAFVVQTLSVQQEPLGPKFVAAGVTSLQQSCLLLTHRG
jgi:thiopurine S-methyltransferase